MNSIAIENEEVTIAVPQYQCNKIYLLMLRFYFIFFPMYPLISKFLGTSLWKDSLYLFFTLVGVNVFIKNKFFLLYFSTLILTVLFQVAQGYSYLEYITWFLMGPPLFLYFRYINPQQYKRDLKFLMLIMFVGVLFVFLYEIPTQDSMVFELESDKNVGGFFLREGLTRARFAFQSPMAFSQYTWFFALIILMNHNIKKIVRITFALLMLFSIFYCNTRAGVFLAAITVVVFFYTKVGLYKIKIYNFLLIAAVAGAVIAKNFISGQNANHNNETLSDELRMLLLLDGLNKAKENFLIGIQGMYFSPRAEDWYDFENSWLSLIVCFGFLGIFLIILLLKNLVFTTTDKYMIFLVIPWLAYSAIFPILQEPTAVFITGFMMCAILSIDKWRLLNAQE